MNRPTSNISLPRTSSWRRWFILLAMAGTLISSACRPSACAQVIFIDSDSIPSAITNATPLASPIHLSVAVLRYLPEGKKARRNEPLSATTTLSQVVDLLGKHGQVNLLFYGERDLSGLTNAVAQFQSTERRPAFSLDAETNQSLTNREFGLRLQISVRPTADQRFEPDWKGTFSWSPNLIDAWAGEKYLMFGMKVAKLIKPGSVYSDDDEDEGSGINIGGLFKKKPKETQPPKSAVELSFLAVDRHEVELKGHQIVNPQELVITTFPVPGADKDQPEFIYLIQQFAASN